MCSVLSVRHACEIHTRQNLRLQSRRQYYDLPIRLSMVLARLLLLPHVVQSLQVGWRAQPAVRRLAAPAMNQCVWGWRPAKTLGDGTKIFDDGSKVVACDLACATYTV